MIDVRHRQVGNWMLCRSHIRMIIVSVVAMSFFFAPLLYFRPHLRWLCKRHCQGVEEVRAIPVFTLHPALVPSDWILCKLGEFELSLPPEFATNRNEVSSCVVFFSGTKKVIVGPPKHAGDALQLLLPTTSQLCGKVKTMTIPQLKLECYKADSNMFCWSMSPEQVQWHVFIMELCRIVRPASESIRLVEYSFDGDIDAVIAFGQRHAILDWESKEDGFCGYIHFVDAQNDIDMDWIRSVCWSIRVSSRKQLTNSKNQCSISLNSAQ